MKEIKTKEKQSFLQFLYFIVVYFIVDAFIFSIIYISLTILFKWETILTPMHLLSMIVYVLMLFTLLRHTLGLNGVLAWVIFCRKSNISIWKAMFYNVIAVYFIAEIILGSMVNEIFLLTYFYTHFGWHVYVSILMGIIGSSYVMILWCRKKSMTTNTTT